MVARPYRLAPLAKNEADGKDGQTDIETYRMSRPKDQLREKWIYYYYPFLYVGGIGSNLNKFYSPNLNSKFSEIDPF